MVADYKGTLYNHTLVIFHSYRVINNRDKSSLQKFSHHYLNNILLVDEWTQKKKLDFNVNKIFVKHFFSPL